VGQTHAHRHQYHVVRHAYRAGMVQDGLRRYTATHKEYMAEVRPVVLYSHYEYLHDPQVYPPMGEGLRSRKRLSGVVSAQFLHL
jgi:hypothetical protein